MVFAFPIGFYAGGWEPTVDRITDDFGYRFLDDGTVEISRYYGNESELVIPAIIDRYTVSGLGNSSFAGNISLSKVTVSTGIKQIGNMVFANCRNLQEITVPDSVIKIGNDAFTYTPWLNNQPEGVVYAGKTVYKYKGECPSEVDIQTGTVSICSRAFYGRSTLASITIPDTVMNIGGYAFEDCTNLTNINVPFSVTSIGNGAFENCTSLLNVNYTDSITFVGDRAFAETAWLENQPDGLIYIGKAAYVYKGECSDWVEIKKGTKSISGYAFAYSDSLKSITIPQSVESIGYDAFYGCSSLENVYIEDISAWCNIDFSEEGFANPLINNANLFLNGELLTDLVVPDTVSDIGDAFRGCISIETVRLPKSVTIVRDNAFDECVALKKIVIPNTVTSIGAWAFDDCSSLIDIQIPDSVASIGGGAFYDCSSLIDIQIPDSVASIGGNAFHNCTNLERIIIPDKVTTIELETFAGCSNLVNVTIGKSVESIEYAAFQDCTSIATIVIPDSVKVIEHYAFDGCSSLESITISENLADVGNDVFRGTPWLENQPEGLIYTGRVAYQHNGSCPTHVDILEGTVSIADNAFFRCTTLESISIPNTVTTIGSCAFYDCRALSDITIPDSVKTIEYDAFMNCDSLKNIVLPSTVKKIETEAFGFYEDYYLAMNSLKYDDFIITGYHNTEAERYANDNGFAFISLGDAPKLTGDADGDGEVTVMDVSEVQHYLSSMKTNASEEMLMYADVDKNGLLEVIDTTWMQRYIAGMDIPYQIG